MDAGAAPFAQGPVPAGVVAVLLDEDGVAGLDEGVVLAEIEAEVV